jgi:hypothetical protein
MTVWLTAIAFGVLSSIGISPSEAVDTITNPNWYILIWDSGYSDWMISPHGHEQLSGEWAAAVRYDQIPNGEAMWFERQWICPDWVSNSNFFVVQPFQSWDDPANPVIGRDTGQGIISNEQVEIRINISMVEGRTSAGLTPGVAFPDHILSHHYVMLQTYTVKNITGARLSNVALFQMMHAQPNDDYAPNNYGVYDPTLYLDPSDAFQAYHYDMTFFAPDANWSEYRDDIIGFSSTRQPDAWGLGEFPSPFCGGGEPGPTSLHHLVEADLLPFGRVAGPLEIAGAMKWNLGDLELGKEVQHTVLFWTGHSPAGLPPASHVPIDIKPQSCPNPLSVKDGGVLPVAVLGTAAFDVAQIDPTSIELEGIQPLRFNFEDVATPFEPFVGKNDCSSSCTTKGSDGYLDFTLKFRARDVIEVLGKGSERECRILTLRGYLKEEYGRTPILGEDVVVVINK